MVINKIIITEWISGFDLKSSNDNRILSKKPSLQFIFKASDKRVDLPFAAWMTESELSYCPSGRILKFNFSDMRIIFDNLGSLFLPFKNHHKGRPISIPIN